jgi:deoxyribonuclease V
LIAFLDVDYRERGAVAAAVLANDWADPAPAAEVVSFNPEVAEYVPGEFYRRELPCLLAVLGRCPAVPDIVVVDGYVWLGPDRPGLGARLHEALRGRAPVVGVAKTRFHSAAPVAVGLRRGGTRHPLWITAVGMDPLEAAREIGFMGGPHRVPTLLRRVDRLARSAMPAESI